MLSVVYGEWRYAECRYAECRYAECNEEESAASFCLQVSAWVPDMFCNMNFVKNLKIAKNSTTNKAIEQIWNY
jgi:hypothetical protein